MPFPVPAHARQPLWHLDTHARWLSQTSVSIPAPCDICFHRDEIPRDAPHSPPVQHTAFIRKRELINVPPSLRVRRKISQGLYEVSISTTPGPCTRRHWAPHVDIDLVSILVSQSILPLVKTQVESQIKGKPRPYAALVTQLVTSSLLEPDLAPTSVLSQSATSRARPSPSPPPSSRRGPTPAPSSSPRPSGRSRPSSRPRWPFPPAKSTHSSSAPRSTSARRRSSTRSIVSAASRTDAHYVCVPSHHN